MNDEAEILFEKRGAVGLITLNRPKALNALTHAMCVAMKAQLEAWAKRRRRSTASSIQGEGERAFCAGGDIRTLYDSGKAGTPYAVRLLSRRILLNASIKHYPKPYIALLRGIVMGGGVGVSVHGSHRIADETMLFAMPETGIGLFPDVGGSFFLPRLSGRDRHVSGTDGRTAEDRRCALRRSCDAFRAGGQARSADRCACGRHRHRTQRCARCRKPGRGNSCRSHREAIDRIFSGAVDRSDSDRARCRRQSTGRAIRPRPFAPNRRPRRSSRSDRSANGKSLSFDDCMRMEFRMVNRVIAGHDFYEGVRATIIDKDGAPHWKPARACPSVSDADIDAYFAPLGNKELPL